MTGPIIVAGVSSAGKSTFISNTLVPRLVAEGTKPEEIDMLFAGKLARTLSEAPEDARAAIFKPRRTSILHYNLLLPIVSSGGKEGFDVGTEPVAQALRAEARTYRLYLCYAPDAVIRARMQTREDAEPQLNPGQMPYPSDRFTGYFAKIDQRQALLSLERALRPQTTSVSVIYSNANETTELSLDAFIHGQPDAQVQAALTA
ncbi:MAG: hypothetical protein AAF718_10690 [Pseudomonadota bacterium]